MAISISGTSLSPGIVDALNAVILPSTSNSLVSENRYGTYDNSGVAVLFDFPENAGVLVNWSSKNIIRLPEGKKLTTTTKTLVVSANILLYWSDLSMSYLETLNATGNTNITNFNNLLLPQTLQTLNCGGCTSLNDYIDFATGGLYNISSVSYLGCALDQPSIDATLQSLVDLINDPLYVGTPGTIDLSAGTNAVPSVTGFANAATLSAFGFNVIVNYPAVLDINSFTQTGCSGTDQLVDIDTTISGYSNVNLQIYNSVMSMWVDGPNIGLPNLSNGMNSISIPMGAAGPNFTQARLKDYTTLDLGTAINITLTVCP